MAQILEYNKDKEKKKKKKRERELFSYSTKHRLISSSC